MRVLVLVFMVIGCGEPHDYMPYVKTKNKEFNEFTDYVNMFERDALVYGHDIQITDLIIEFGEPENPMAVGVCITRDDATPIIQIRQSYWESTTETYRQILMYHELGHCVLNRGHIEPTLYLSIMNPHIMHSSLFDVNRSKYIDELFNPMLSLYHDHSSCGGLHDH